MEVPLSGGNGADWRWFYEQPFLEYGVMRYQKRIQWPMLAFYPL